MIREIDKYRSRFFQIMAFSFMGPLGKVVINYIDAKSIEFNLKFLISLLIALFLAVMGIILNIKRNGAFKRKRGIIMNDPHIITMLFIFFFILALTYFAYIKIGKPKENKK